MFKPIRSAFKHQKRHGETAKEVDSITSLNTKIQHDNPNPSGVMGSIKEKRRNETS